MKGRGITITRPDRGVVTNGSWWMTADRSTFTQSDRGSASDASLQGRGDLGVERGRADVA
jgi:hypothetical protein